MREDATLAWERLHVHAEAAIVWYFGSVVTHVCLLAYMMYGAGNRGAYVQAFNVLMSVCLVLTFCAQSGVWHFGHRIKQYAVYKITLVAKILPCMVALVLASIAPTDEMPFGSYVHFIAVLAAIVFTAATITMIMPVAIPREAQRGLLPIVGKAFIFTIRVMDASTEISFVQVLEALVRLLSL